MLRSRLASVLAAAVPAASLVLFTACSGGSSDRLFLTHVQAARTALAEGSYNRALIALNRANELRPNSAEVQVLAMRAHVGGAASDPQTITDQNINELEYAATVLMREAPDAKHVTLTALGNVYARANRAEQATEKYREAIAVKADYAPAHLYLGQVLAQGDKTDDAMKEFDAALAADPTNLGATNGLAELLVRADKADDAIAKLTAALEKRDHAVSRLVLGNAFAAKEKWQEAFAAYQRAAELDPRSAEARRRMGTLLFRANQFPEAEKSFRAALELERDATTYFNLGVTLGAQKRYRDAVDLFTELIRQNPTAPGPLFQTGLMLEAAGEQKKALRYYEEYLKYAQADPAEQARAQEVAAKLKAARGEEQAAVEAPAAPAEAAKK